MKIKVLGILILLASFLAFSFKISAQKNLSILGFEQDNQNWIVQGDDIWSNSEVTTKGTVVDQRSYQIAKETFGNFELTLEFKPDSTINSGVFIRCPKEEMNPDDCLEINIWDLHPNQDFSTGSIVKKQKPKTKVKTLNKWNTYRIKCKNSKVKVWVNGVLTANYIDPSPLKGYIGLQANGTGTIEFRNVEIKRLRKLKNQ